MQHPKRIETVHVETLEGELCIYDWQRMEVHNLNPTAATVWQLCDGQTTPQQMAGQLKGDLTPAQAEELVWLTLERLEKANLLETEAVKPAGRKVYTRREMLVRLGVTAALLPVVSSIVAPGPVEAQSPVPPGSQTFSFTGAEQTFTVPAGATSVTIEASGAQGAQGGDGFGNPVAGGLGGFVRATIPVTPGETLFIYVGGAGITSGAGGFNGGGAGAAGIAPRVSGGGGGASDVRQGGTALTNRVVIAGGGGGGGGGSGIPGSGGAGGDTSGAAGSNGGGASGGGGGTPAAGGAGGTGNPGPDGANGVLGIGGSGGTGNSEPGGGGGGGYYGGGGGESGPEPGAAGGGGGGSSFTVLGATGVAHTQGARSGDGEVVISW